MTLLITVFAALVSSIVWYKNTNRNLNLGFLSLMFWGAALMWFVDSIFEYLEDPTLVFSPPAGDMLNDAYLGLCVVALGLIIWFVSLLIRDPLGKFKKN